MAMYRIKKKSFWNWLGLYTKYQVEEVQNRANELWRQLNSAYSTIEVYLPEVEHAANKLDELEKDSIMSNELFLLKAAIVKLRTCSDDCYHVMFSDEPKRA